MSKAPLVDSFAEIEDSRCSRNTLYPIEEIVLLAICGAISGADDFVALAGYRTVFLIPAKVEEGRCPRRLGRPGCGEPITEPSVLDRQ